MLRRRTKKLPSERISIRISRTSRDVYGNETSSRTYYSASKYIQHTDGTNERSPDQLSSPKNTQKRKSSKSTNKYTQIPLFPPTE